MKKLVFGRHLSRGEGARRALFKSLIRSLVGNGSVKTTKAKAKAIQGQVDKLMNLAKDNSMNGKRRVYSFLGNDRKATADLYVVAEGFGDTKSGFTRIINLPRRKGDMAQVVRMEWSKEILKSKAEKSKKVLTEDKKIEKKSLKDRLTKLGKKDKEVKESSGKKTKDKKQK